MKKRMLGGVGVAIVLAVAAGANPAWAHGKTQPQQQSKGLVTGVGASALHVQTSNGSATFGFNGNTRVTRIVTGSMADLATGQIVEAQFVDGSTTVKSIRIEAAHAPSSSKQPHDTRDGNRGDWSAWTTRGAPPTGRNGWFPHQPWDVEGQLVSSTDRSITLHTRTGNQTFTLAGNVAVTKVLPGKTSNLATGETVQVCVNRGSTLAVWIAILNS